MAKTERNKEATNVDNSPEAIAIRVQKSIQIATRNAAAGELFGKSYDDLDTEKQALVRQSLKGAGRKDGAVKGESKPKDAYAISIQTEPFGRHISILMSPKLIAKANALGRINNRSYSCMVRELIDKAVSDKDVKEEDYHFKKDGTTYDIRVNKVGSYTTPVNVRKAQ